MTTNRTEVTEFVCDVKDCKERQTIVGSLAFDIAHENGWRTEVVIFDHDPIDMCPTCVKDLEFNLFEPEVPR